MLRNGYICNLLHDNWKSITKGMNCVIRIPVRKVREESILTTWVSAMIIPSRYIETGTGRKSSTISVKFNYGSKHKCLQQLHVHLLALYMTIEGYIALLLFWLLKLLRKGDLTHLNQREFTTDINCTRSFSILRVLGRYFSFLFELLYTMSQGDILTRRHILFGMSHEKDEMLIWVKRKR